jgi:hypothetical protein
LWTIHPRYLDAKGLVAAWREALLAQKVLAGATRGYRHHPQLKRFQAHANPRAAIAMFLRGLADEAQLRGYQFDTTKIARHTGVARIAETRGQLLYEWRHLKLKLRVRAPEVAKKFRGIAAPEPHPIFRIVASQVREWEKTTRPNSKGQTPKKIRRRKFKSPSLLDKGVGRRSRRSAAVLG